LLAGAPAKGIASYLEEALVADIDACEDPRALMCVQEVMGFMVAAGRLKKDLAGFDLSAPAKKSCRTASNRAAKVFGELEVRGRQAALKAGTLKPREYEMDKDVRLEDAETAEARYQANAEGLDRMFEQAMRVKNKRLSQ
jgi:hypothetical protein